MAHHHVPELVPATPGPSPARILLRLRRIARAATHRAEVEVTRPIGSGNARWLMHSRACFTRRTIWHFSCGQATVKVDLPIRPDDLVPEVFDEALRALALVTGRDPDELRAEILAPEEG
jgi:hypothetical protein